MDRPGKRAEDYIIMNIKDIFPSDKRMMGIFTQSRSWLQYANVLGVQAMIGDEDLPFESFHVILPGSTTDRREVARIFPQPPGWLDSIPAENLTAIDTEKDLNDILSAINPSSSIFKSHTFFFDDFRSIMEVIGSQPKQLSTVFKTLQASTRYANKFMMTNVSPSVPAVDKRYCDRVCSLTSSQPSTIELTIIGGSWPYILSLAHGSLRFEIISRKASERAIFTFVEDIARRLAEASTDRIVSVGQITSELIEEGFSRLDSETAIERFHDAGGMIQKPDGQFKVVKG